MILPWSFAMLPSHFKADKTMDHHDNGQAGGTGLGRREFVLAAAGIATLGASAPAPASSLSAEVLPAPPDPRPVVLVTGANRGLGLEFVRLYMERDWRVIATAREPARATALRELAASYPALHIEPLDVADHAQVDQLAARYARYPVDVLINNAGIGGGGDNQVFGRLNYPVLEQVMTVNAAGPIKMCEAFLPHVRASGQKKMITVSSSQGSIASVEFPMLYWYRASKAAVNMLMANLALQLRRQGIIVGLVTPGATDTDFMAGVNMPLRDPRVAAEDMLRNIDRYTLELSGTFFDYTGEIIPW